MSFSIIKVKSFVSTVEAENAKSVIIDLIRLWPSPIVTLLH